jgi:DNA replication and repair protein RecF
MRLSELSLTGFRSYAELEARWDERGALLWGDNGTGKTNLLEAIHVLSVGRSHRTQNDREMLAIGSPALWVRGAGASEQAGAVEVEVGLRPGEAKRARVNGKDERLSGIVGQIGAVLVAPEDLEIARGGPDRRRRFVDQLLCQARRANMAALQSYARALRQRNQALREARDGRAPAALAAAWHAPLVEWGTRVRAARADVVRRLAEVASRLYREVSGRDEALEATYPAAGEDLGGALARVAAAEARRGTTLAGPHRDDIAVTLDGKDLRAYGSRGQQRAAAFALRLGSAAVFREERGEEPILLLDDVFAELDAGRADRLARVLAGRRQVFATATTSAELAGRFPGVPAYRVTPGRVEAA